MFCLRSWAPLLIFLTNAAPIYVLLFLTATYALQRPCVYCSILLFVIVFLLFDFGADWFEPRWSSEQVSASGTASPYLSGNATLSEAIIETASMAVAALNGTGGSLASAAVECVKRRAVGGTGSASGNSTATSTGLEWLKAVLEKKQFRIPCVDVVVRL